MGDNSKRVKILWKIFKNLLLQNQQTNFNQTWYKSFLGKREFKNCTNQGRGPFLRGDNHKK
jgi:hypothetical protein